MKNLQSFEEFLTEGFSKLKYYSQEESYLLTGHGFVKPDMRKDFAGNFSTKESHFADYYLYELDNYDKQLYKYIKLGPSEKLYRFETEKGRIAGLVPLVKINIDKGLIYFDEADYDKGEEPKFATRGIKAEWINLIQK